jgi:hypothetical protein
MQTRSEYRYASIVLVTALLLSGCAPEQPPQLEYPARPNFLALGDSVSGRNVFIEMGCPSCHKVAGDAFEVKAPDGAAPRLGSANAEQSPETVAGSILLPSHSISKAPGVWTATGQSQMGDYGGRLTVRQLVDLIAYLRTPARHKDSLTRNANP